MTEFDLNDSPAWLPVRDVPWMYGVSRFTGEAS